MPSISPINATVLDASIPTRFSVNTTIGTMLDELMVEQWNWSINYDYYYAACQPSQCSYTLTAKNDAVYIVTTLIGLIGGLVTALKLIVPPFVQLIRNRSRQTTGTLDHS
jgi:hypothetical protein